MRVPSGLLALVCGAGLTGVAPADELRVPRDFPTIQAAFDASVSGDEILIASGTYTGAGAAVAVLPRHDLVVRGEGDGGGIGGGTAIIDGAGVRRGFSLPPNPDDPSDPGPAIELRDLVFRACVADERGGGLHLATSDVHLDTVDFLECRAGAAGGGLWHDDGQLSGVDVRFIKCAAPSGAAMRSFTFSPVSLTGVSFETCFGADDSLVRLDGARSVDAQDVTISGCDVRAFFESDGFATVTVSSLTVTSSGLGSLVAGTNQGFFEFIAAEVLTSQLGGLGDAATTETILRFSDTNFLGCSGALGAGGQSQIEFSSTTIDGFIATGPLIGEGFNTLVADDLTVRNVIMPDSAPAPMFRLDEPCSINGMQVDGVTGASSIVATPRAFSGSRVDGLTVRNTTVSQAILVNRGAFPVDAIAADLCGNDAPRATLGRWCFGPDALGAGPGCGYTCAGDADASGAVDISDLLATLAAFGGGDCSGADADASGDVDVTDVLLVLSSWGDC